MWKEKPACVMAIPSTNEFASVRQVITSTLEEHNVETLDYSGDTAAKKGASASIEAIEAVERADMIIADVTDATNKNPLLLYEIGLADAMRKPVLLLAQKSPTVPSQLVGHQVVVYEPNETEQLGHYLNSWLKTHPLEQYK